jgi:hypothetical protein
MNDVEGAAPLTDDSPPFSLGAVSILRAFAPGDVVIIESDRHYSTDENERIMTYFGKVSEATGIRFVLLVQGMRVAGRETKQT